MLRYRPLPRADRGLVDQISMHRLCLRSAAICELGGVLYLNFAQRSAARGELKRYLEEQTSSTRPVAALLIALLGLSGRFGRRVGTFATGQHQALWCNPRYVCLTQLHFPHDHTCRRVSHDDSKGYLNLLPPKETPLRSAVRCIFAPVLLSIGVAWILTLERARTPCEGRDGLRRASVCCPNDG